MPPFQSQHADANVNKILVGNKCDSSEEEKVIKTSQGQQLAQEYKVQFFETSAKLNIQVEEVLDFPPL